MISEIDGALTDLQAICNSTADESAIEIAEHAADLLSQVVDMLPGELHKRKCRDCGAVAYHADCRVPYVLCRGCGSQDTRKI